MITGKQRAYLRSLANGIKPITQIGKDGVTDAFIKQLDAALNTRELVKVHVLENSGLDVKECANEVVKRVNGNFVQAIGSKFTVYKRSKDNQQIKLPKK